MHKLLCYLVISATVLATMVLGTSAHADTLTADIDRTQISKDESLTLTLQYSGSRINSDPDFSALNQNFEVQSNGKSMKHSVVNGSVTSSTEWQVRLWPKKAGQLLIPPLSVNNVSSKALRISVSDGTTQTVHKNNRSVFVEAHVDKKTAFVQEQVLLTYRVYYKERFSYDNGGDFTFDNARTEALPTAEYQKTLNGAVFNVLEFRYAIFPDSSGTLTIPERLWQFQTNPSGRFSHGFGGGRQQLFRQKVAAMSIEVKPKPAGFPAQASWMPASAVTLQESWSQEPDSFTLGEPITRTITLGVRGQTAEQLPVIFDPQNDEQFKYYPDKPVLQADQKPDGIIGMRQDIVAIVPSKTGDLTLPAIEIPWWNVETNSVQTARLPARTVKVVAGLGSNNSDIASTNPQLIAPVGTNTSSANAPNNALWFWLALASIALNLILFGWLLFTRNGRQVHAKADPSTSSAEPALGKALKQLEAQCKKQNAAAVRQTLLIIAAQLPLPGAATLSALATQSNDAFYAQALMNLDASLFADQSAKVDYGLIYTATRRVSQDITSNNSINKQTETDLPALYASV